MAKKSEPKKVEIEIEELKIARLKICLLGTTPLISHRFAAKAWKELLLPAPEKNAAERAASLKHDPVTEFRETLYINRDPKQPTLIHYPAGAFSKAMAAAALDIPGARKAQILRLVSLATTQVNLYGVPFLGMEMVRSGDMARTPDVRTRAYLTEWCAEIEVEFVSTLIGQRQIVNLLAAAGVIVGVGDNRPQKGGTNGKFVTALPDDADVVRIKQHQARAAQQEAYASPSFFDDQSAEIYAWFVDELKRREKVAPSSRKDGKPELQPATLVAAEAAAKKRNGKSKRVHI
jgi:hypothetical protein